MSISDFIVLIRLLACFPEVYLPQTAYNGRSLGLHKRMLLKRSDYVVPNRQTDTHGQTTLRL